jgi:hypothetical protein
MINKDQDDVFTESQIKKIKTAFMELDSHIGINSFDQNVQLKILRNRLEQIRVEESEEGSQNFPQNARLETASHAANQSVRDQLHIRSVGKDIASNNIATDQIYKQQKSQRTAKLGMFRFTYNFIKNLMPTPTLAMTLAFVSGVALTSSYYFVIDESINESQTIRSSSLDEESHSLISAALDVDMTAPNSVENRSQIIESAMRAKLRVIAHVKDNSIVLSIDGLKENDPTQLAFKALTGLSPSQSGAVNLKFKK